MYNEALEVGIYPAEFWDMSMQEVRDTVTRRIRQKQNEIYTLSAMIRVAVASAISAENKFPASAAEAFGREEKREGNWKNSYNYIKALQKLKQGGAK